MDNVGPGPLVLAFVQDIVMRATYFYAKRMCLMYNVAHRLHFHKAQH